MIKDKSNKGSKTKHNHRGEKNPMFGKRHSEATRKRMRETHLMRLKLERLPLQTDKIIQEEINNFINNGTIKFNKG